MVVVVEYEHASLTNVAVAELLVQALEIIFVASYPFPSLTTHTTQSTMVQLELLESLPVRIESTSPYYYCRLQSLIGYSHRIGSRNTQKLLTACFL